MEDGIVLVDGGTTYTRFTLLKGGSPAAESRIRAGAADADRPGSNPKLEEAVRTELVSLEARFGCRIQEVYASGMIGSANGLCEIPHLPAPAGLWELSAAVAVREIKSLPGVRFHFVPGVRFEAGSGEPSDMMRGEETEIMGALGPGDEERRLFFLHFGSHSKLMATDRGRITDSATTLGGELLSAICTETLLRSSVPDFRNVDFPQDTDFIRRGCLDAGQYGFSRALFLARTGQVLEGASPEETFSRILGVIIQADLQAFRPKLNREADALILYGRPQFTEAFRACLPLMAFNRNWEGKTRLILPEESRQLSVRGLLKISGLGSA